MKTQKKNKRILFIRNKEKYDGIKKSYGIYRKEGECTGNERKDRTMENWAAMRDSAVSGHAMLKTSERELIIPLQRERGGRENELTFFRQGEKGKRKKRNE